MKKNCHIYLSVFCLLLFLFNNGFAQQDGKSKSISAKTENYSEKKQKRIEKQEKCVKKEKRIEYEKSVI